MFDRFDDDARRLLVFALDAAREHRHLEVGADHLLLAIATREPGRPTELAAAGLDPDELLGSLTRSWRYRTGDAVNAHLPMTDEYHAVLDAAAAQAGGDDQVGSAAMLVALLDSTGPAGTALRGAVADPAALRATLVAGPR